MSGLKVVLVEPRPPFNVYYFAKKLPLLGGLFLGRVLREAGHEVRVFKEEIAPVYDERHDRLHPAVRAADVVGITAITHTVNRAYRIADAIRRQFPGKRVILGGSHPTALPREALEHADQVVTGEGELVIRDVVEGRLAGRTVAGPRVDIDEVPMVDLSLLEGTRYAGSGRVGLPTAPIMASRGCPHECVFCSVTRMFGRECRVRSPERVVEELRLRAREGFRWAFFYDDNFAAVPAKTRLLLEQLARARLGIGWTSQFSVHAAQDPELLRLLPRAGCHTVLIGVESISPAALKDLNKSQTVELIRSSIDAFLRAGLKVHSMFVLGADSDDESTIEETIRFSRASGSATAQFSILFPIPGTRLYRSARQQGRIFVTNWDYFDGSHAVMIPGRIAPYRLQRKLIEAYKSFYGGRPIHWLASRLGFLLWRGANGRYLRLLKRWSRGSTVAW